MDCGTSPAALRSWDGAKGAWSRREEEESEGMRYGVGAGEPGSTAEEFAREMSRESLGVTGESGSLWKVDPVEGGGSVRGREGREGGMGEE
eukprot:1660616-Rhodomonas_salina.1